MWGAGRRRIPILILAMVSIGAVAKAETKLAFSTDLSANSPEKAGNHKHFQLNFPFAVSFSKFGGMPLKFINDLNANTGYTFEQTKRIGFPLGCDFNIYLKPWLSLKTGLFYTNKGMKVKDTFILNNYYDVDLHITLIANYLEAPFLIELSTVPGRNSSSARFFINGGITAGLLMKSKIWTELGASFGDGGVEYEQVMEDWKDVNSLDYGYMVGIGCYFKSGLSLAIDYAEGLRTVSSEGWDFKNQVFSIKIGYYFQW